MPQMKEKTLNMGSLLETCLFESDVITVVDQSKYERQEGTCSRVCPVKGLLNDRGGGGCAAGSRA